MWGLRGGPSAERRASLRAAVDCGASAPAAPALPGPGWNPPRSPPRPSKLPRIPRVSADNRCTRSNEHSRGTADSRFAAPRLVLEKPGDLCGHVRDLLRGELREDRQGQRFAGRGLGDGEAPLAEPGPHEARLEV